MGVRQMYKVFYSGRIDYAAIDYDYIGTGLTLEEAQSLKTDAEQFAGSDLIECRIEQDD
jgi:hypothetical protein